MNGLTTSLLVTDGMADRTTAKRALPESPSDRELPQPPEKISKSALPRSASSPSLPQPVFDRQPVLEDFNAMLEHAINALTSRFDSMELRLMRVFDERLERFEARMFDAERRADMLEFELKKRQEECVAKEEKIDNLSRQVTELREKADDHEQYQRRSNIRISGLPEKDRETIEECEKVVQNFLSKELQIEETIKISIAHRLGRKKTGETRPIICRLVRRADKSTIMRKRKILRERKSSIYLAEDLTQRNQRLFRDVRANPRIKKAWTVDGKVMAEGLNGQKIHNVRSAADVDRLLDRYNRS